MGCVTKQTAYIGNCRTVGSAERNIFFTANRSVQLFKMYSVQVWNTLYNGIWFIIQVNMIWKKNDKWSVVNEEPKSYCWDDSQQMCFKKIPLKKMIIRCNIFYPVIYTTIFSSTFCAFVYNHQMFFFFFFPHLTFLIWWSCLEEIPGAEQALIKSDLVGKDEGEKSCAWASILNDVRGLRSNKASVEADVNACSNKNLVLAGMQKQI